jgi:transitional endoplasmic reticulum ATPase
LLLGAWRCGRSQIGPYGHFSITTTAKEGHGDARAWPRPAVYADARLCLSAASLEPFRSMVDATASMLARAAWFQLSAGPVEGSVTDSFSAKHPSRLQLRAHALLNGRVVTLGDTLPFAAGQTLRVVKVSGRGEGAASKLTSGRITCHTALHIDVVRGASQASFGDSAAAEAGAHEIFAAQRRGYDAVCALLHATTPRRAASLRDWRIRPPSGVMLSGPPGTGKTHIVRTAAAAFGAPVVAFSGATPAGGGGADEESGARLRTAFARAEGLSRQASEARGMAVPAILFLDELDVYCPKRSEGTTSAEQSRCVAVLLVLLDGLRSRHGRVLAVAASNRPDAIDAALRRPGRLEWEVPLSLPSQAERESALATSCVGMPLHTSVRLADVASQCSGYAAADLLGLAREALLSAARRHAASSAGEASVATTTTQTPSAQAISIDDDAHVTDTPRIDGVCQVHPCDFDMALRQSRASVLRTTSTSMPPVEPLSWEDIGGAREAKLSLQRAVEWPMSRADRFAELGIVPPRGVLLHGPPGCAKTSLARAAAGAAGVSFLYLSGASLYSPFVGEAERALRELFALGRACAPAILFLDELEAIVGSRASVDGGSGAGGGEAVQLRVLSTLLNEMDGISPLARVVIVGATNRPDMLDAALLRPGRFDELVEVSLPDAAGRLQIMSIHTRKMPLSSRVSLDGIANECDGWSGAQLGALCREAGMEALREHLRSRRPAAGEGAAADDGTPPLVDQRHFMSAMRRVHGARGGS